MHLVNTQTNRKVAINQKEKINCVRMFLGEYYVSEISTVDGTIFVPGILEGDDSQLNYRTTLTKSHQERPGEYSWRLWKRILKMVTPSPKANTQKLTKRPGKWIDTHSESRQWLLYKDHAGNFYSRGSHDDTEWKVYKRTKKGTQLTCIKATAEYQPTKHSIPVRTHTSAGGKIYRELGAGLKIDDESLEGPAESSKQLIVDQPA